MAKKSQSPLFAPTKRRTVIQRGHAHSRRHGLRRVEYSTTDYILKYVYDVVVKEVHVRCLISWCVSCKFEQYSVNKRVRNKTAL